MKVGTKLRILRGERTLKTVATAIGMSFTFLSDVERNRPNVLPSLDTCQRLADLYGVSLAEMFRDVRIDGGDVVSEVASESNTWE